MGSHHEFVGELEGHAIHVSHRQHREDIDACLDFVAEDMTGEVAIAPKCPVGNHHALRVAGCSAGIVQHSHLVGLVLVVAEELRQEAARELLSKEAVEVLAGIGQLFIAADKQTVVDQRDDTQQVGHFVGIESRPYLVAHKEKLRF